jgi:aryl-alcohol dehydrogenase-like predicted oxidoreductase
MFDRHIEGEIMSVCQRHGMGLTVFSPLAQGLLTGKYNDGIPDDSRAEKSEGLRNSLTEQNLDRVRRLTDVAVSLDLEMSQLALAWNLRRPEISSVITGATKPSHVESNARASGIHLPDDLLAEIEEILGSDPSKV